MSFQNSNLPIQQYVSQYGNTGRNYRVIEAVMNASNRNTSVRIDSSTFLNQPGKKRSVKIIYYPMNCDAVADDCSSTICDTGDKVEPKQEFFTISKCIASKIFKINKDDIRYVDGAFTYNTAALETISHALPALRKAVAVEWLTTLYADAGLHLDGNTSHRVTMTNPATGVINPIGKLEIEKEFMDGGFMEPVIIGGSEVYKWQQMVGIGGLNAQGQNVGQVSVSNTYYDDGLSDLTQGDVANGGHILAIDPQVFKLVFYSENAGIFRTDLSGLEDLTKLYSRGSESFLEGTLLDPVTGILWDLDISYSKCDKDWNVQLKVRYDIFVMPPITCNDVQAVNGIMKYRTCPEVIAPCPSGDPIPSPIVASNRDASAAGFTYPYTVAKITIGNQTTEFSNGGTAIANITELVALLNDSNNGYVFTNPAGTTIRYSGYSNISISFNDGERTLSFS